MARTVVIIGTLDTKGAEIAYLEFAEKDSPWLKLIGVYKDDPYLDDYKQAVAEYRKQVNEDPDRL